MIRFVTGTSSMGYIDRLHVQSTVVREEAVHRLLTIEDKFVLNTGFRHVLVKLIILLLPSCVH
jgi:hypothetical protein